MTHSPSDAAAPGATLPTSMHGRWWPLLVLLSGTFLVVLDFFIINVAVPSLRSDLGASGAQIQLVVAGYGLTYAAGLVVGGRIGDLFGHRRMFRVGMAGFMAASLACGLAPSIEVLILARLVQGTAAAVMAPQVLTLLGVMFDGSSRERAFGGYGVALGVASGAGQIVGGALIDLDPFGLGWRSCFLVNLPIGAAAIIATGRLIPESHGEGSRRLDLAGALAITAAMVTLVYPLIEGRRQGWPPWTWLCFTASASLFVAFVRHERGVVRRGGAPLVHPALFTDRAFTTGIASVLVFYSGVASFFLVLSLYLQDGRGLGPFASGVVFSVMVVGFLVTTFAGRRVSDRLGRHALAIGALAIAGGHLLLRTSIIGAGPDGSLWSLLPALLVTGAGIGVVMAPLVSLVLAGITPAHAGAASGVLAAGQQLGNALGVALLGIVYFGITGPEPTATDVIDAVATSHLYLFVLGVLVALLIDRLRPAPRAPGRPPRPDT